MEEGEDKAYKIDANGDNAECLYTLSVIEVHKYLLSSIFLLNL